MDYDVTKLIKRVDGDKIEVRYLGPGYSITRTSNPYQELNYYLDIPCFFGLFGRYSLEDCHSSIEISRDQDILGALERACKRNIIRAKEQREQRRIESTANRWERL